MQCILRHNTTKFRRYYPYLDVNTDNIMYFEIVIDTRDFEDGEYTIQLFTDDNVMVGEDIIKLGKYKNNKQQYKIEKKYTQYARK